MVNPTSPSKSKAQTQFEIKNYNNELMSHLLCLNSCDNYPNKCPHICLHLLVKQHPQPPGFGYRSGGLPLTEDAHYTDRTSPCKGFWKNNSGFLPGAEKQVNYPPELRRSRPFLGLEIYTLVAAGNRRCKRRRLRRQPSNTAKIPI